MICLLPLFLFSSAELSAQKEYVKSIKWEIAGTLPPVNGRSLGVAGPVAGIDNGVLIVGGGCNFPEKMPWLGGRKQYYNDLYVFKKSKQGSLWFFKEFKLPFSLAYAANCPTPQGIVVAGGENEKGSSRKVLLLRWDEKKRTIRIKELPDLPYPVTNAAAVTLGSRVYLAGGEMKDGVSDRFLALDLNTIRTTGWQNLPTLPKPISHTVMVAQSDGGDDCIYLMGGRKKNPGRPSDIYASTFQFNVRTEQWMEKRNLPYSLSAATGVAIGADAVLLLGGDKGVTFRKTEELIMAIDNERNEEWRRQLEREKIQLQSAHPGFCKQILLYNTRTDEWDPVGEFPYDPPVTTTAVKWNDEIIIPGGEIRAGVRTPRILCANIIF